MANVSKTRFMISITLAFQPILGRDAHPVMKSSYLFSKLEVCGNSFPTRLILRINSLVLHGGSGNDAGDSFNPLRGGEKRSFPRAQMEFTEGPSLKYSGIRDSAVYYNNIPPYEKPIFRQSSWENRQADDRMPHEDRLANIYTAPESHRAGRYGSLHADLQNRDGRYESRELRGPPAYHTYGGERSSYGAAHGGGADREGPGARFYEEGYWRGEAPAPRQHRDAFYAAGHFRRGESGGPYSASPAGVGPAPYFVRDPPSGKPAVWDSEDRRPGPAGLEPQLHRNDRRADRNYGPARPPLTQVLRHTPPPQAPRRARCGGMLPHQSGSGCGPS